VHFSMDVYMINIKARGSVLGWGTTLQIVRSRVRIPRVSLDFFNLPNHSSRTMALGSTYKSVLEQ
jgi:hypothetical protein